MKEMKRPKKPSGSSSNITEHFDYVDNLEKYCEQIEKKLQHHKELCMTNERMINERKILKHAIINFLIKWREAIMPKKFHWQFYRSIETLEKLTKGEAIKL